MSPTFTPYTITVQVHVQLFRVLPNSSGLIPAEWLPIAFDLSVLAIFASAA